MILSRLLPRAIKRRIANRIGAISSRELRAELDTLFADNRILKQALQLLAHDAQTLKKENQLLRDLFEYTVARPIDLLRLGEHFYWFYAKERLHPGPDYIAKIGDVKQLPAFEFSISQFWASEYREFPLCEQTSKRLLFAYMWLNNIDFAMLDVGANIGVTAIPCGSFIKRFSKQNQIYSFEPGITSNLFCQNVKLNQLEQIVRFDPRAVSDTARTMVMHSWLNHCESNSLVDMRQYYSTDLAISSLVQTVSIDQFVCEQKITNPLLIKLDAEGQDWPIIEGMTEVLKKQALFVMFEFVPRYIRESIDPVQMLWDFAENWHILFTQGIDNVTTGHCQIIAPVHATIQEFTSLVERSPAGWTDVLLISKKLPDLNPLLQRLCNHQ